MRATLSRGGRAPSPGVCPLRPGSGEPRYRDPVGYTLGPYERRELLIEEWVYGPNNGMLNILTFEGNRLVRIERKRNR